MPLSKKVRVYRVKNEAGPDGRVSRTATRDNLVFEVPARDIDAAKQAAYEVLERRGLRASNVVVSTDGSLIAYVTEEAGAPSAPLPGWRWKPPGRRSKP